MFNVKNEGISYMYDENSPSFRNNAINFRVW